MNRFFLTLMLGFCLAIANCAHADTFGSGINAFEIEFVAIGNPNNVPDTTGDPNPAGAVDYEYRIGKYEIAEQMIDKANVLGGLGIASQRRGPEKPASMTWFEAAKFVNWLNTSSGRSPAYNFDDQENFKVWEPTDLGYNPDNLYRNSLATFFLPSVDEWYKAAYFNPITDDYSLFPTGSDTPPTAVASGTAFDTAVFGHAFSVGPTDVMQAGGLSPNGTMAQGGNIDEWNESDADLLNDDFGLRVFRGGSWRSGALSMEASRRRGSSPEIGNTIIGFRVASVIPEPGSWSLLCIALTSCLLRYRNYLQSPRS